MAINNYVAAVSNDVMAAACMSYSFYEPIVTQIEKVKLLLCLLRAVDYFKLVEVMLLSQCHRFM